MVLWERPKYKCSLRKVPTSNPLISRSRFGSLVNTGGSPNQFSSNELSRRVSFIEVVRAVEMADIPFLDKCLALPFEQVDFADYATGNTVLHVAGRYPNETMEKLLEHPRTYDFMNSQDCRGTTPLIAAAWYGNMPGLKALLNKGATTETALYGSKKTALHISAIHSDSEFVDEILKNNSKSSFINGVDENGDTPLMIGVEHKSSSVYSLIKARADHLYRNAFTGRNILHLAILYEWSDFVKYLIGKFPEKDFLTVSDFYGLTPMMIAAKIKDFDVMKIFLSSKYGKAMVSNYNCIVHDVIPSEDNELLDRVLDVYDKEMLDKWTDSKGRTALMLAVETRSVEAMKTLVRRNVALNSQKEERGFTIVHLASVTRDFEIISCILGANGIETVINVPNLDGITPYELILGHGNTACVNAFRGSNLIPDSQVNTRSETPLFVSAKYNNYGAMLSTLLSESCSEWLSTHPLRDLDIPRVKRGHLKGILSSSDVYILIGEIPEVGAAKTSPPQHHLFWENDDGRNIFHACAIGGNVDCIVFIYNYCELFHPEELKCIDKPDKTGTTPLLLAVLCEHKDVVTYLCIRGANICMPNHKGMSPLSAIPNYIMAYKRLMKDIFNSCIVSDQGDMRNKSSADCMRFTVFNHLLCPPNFHQMDVINNIFKIIPQPEGYDLLNHPLLDFYVWVIWLKIKNAMRARFYIGLVHAILFSIYLTLMYCLGIRADETFVEGLRWTLVCTSFYSAIVNLPTFLVKSSFVRGIMLKALVLTPMLTIIYLVFLNDRRRISLEVGGICVLLAWLILFVHGCSSPIMKQMGMFKVVFKAMIRYSPVFLLIMIAFCFYLFTLFHDYLVFNNPFHSFLFTAFQLPEGELSLLPSMNEKNDAIRNDSTNFNTVEPDQNNLKKLMPMRELRSMIFMGPVILLYLLLSTTVLNMLTALAVRSGEEIELGGGAVSLKMRIERIEEWECFLKSKMFKILKKLKLLWLTLVPSNAAEIFKLESQVNPLINPPQGYNFFKLKPYITEKQLLITNKQSEFLIQWSQKPEESLVSEISIATSSKSSFNKMFLDIYSFTSGMILLTY